MFRELRRFSVLFGMLTPLPIVACGTSREAGPAEERPQLALEDELRIGSADDPEYSFGWFRSLAVGPGENIYTLHHESQLVRVHDPEGRIVRTIGGEGEGPGEFGSAGPMGFLGDTLWVLDYGTYRITYFDAPSGELIESVRVPVDLGRGEGEDPPRPSGLLPDGTMAATTMAWSHLVASGEITETVVFRWTRTGEPIDTLAVRPMRNTTWEVKPPDGSYRSYQSQPFADARIVEWSPTIPEIVYIDRNPREDAEPFFRVTKLGFAGDTVFDISFLYEPIPLTTAIVDSLVRLRARGMSERTDYAPTEAAQWARQTLYTPPFLPPVETALVGMDGSVWLQLADDGEGPLRWLGLEPDGSILGELDAPRAFRPMAATTDRWWGTLTDALDIPYIVRYDIAPAASSPEGGSTSETVPDV